MTADANKSESLLCMDKAREAIKAGDTDKARRFLQKAKKLDPSQSIDYLTKKIDEMTNNSSQSSSRGSEERSYAHDDHYEEPNLRQRHRSPTKANGKPKKEEVKPRSASRTPKLGVDYTKEQLELVERIRHCKDYYEILKVDKKASDDDIRKEYRKMALKLHPDKCRAPHATEAFKALGNAYAVLSDTEKREQYDRYGSDAMSNGNAGTPTRHRRGGHGTFFEHDYAHGFEADFTPEEIFNMFFGGGYPAGELNRRRARYQGQQHQHHYDENQSPYGPLLQLLPLIAIMVLGLLAQLMVGEPAFSLHQTQKYNVRRTTMELRVPYFVRSDFESSYRGRVKQVEQQVEDDYIQNLRMNCYKEQNLRETKIYRARWMRDEGLMREAERTPMPSCVRLNEIYSH